MTCRFRLHLLIESNAVSPDNRFICAPSRFAKPGALLFVLSLLRKKSNRDRSQDHCRQSFERSLIYPWNIRQCVGSSSSRSSAASPPRSTTAWACSLRWDTIRGMILNVLSMRRISKTPPMRSSAKASTRSFTPPLPRTRTHFILSLGSLENYL